MKAIDRNARNTRTPRRSGLSSVAGRPMRSRGSSIRIDSGKQDFEERADYKAALSKKPTRADKKKLKHSLAHLPFNKETSFWFYVYSFFIFLSFFGLGSYLYLESSKYVVPQTKESKNDTSGIINESSTKGNPKNKEAEVANQDYFTLSSAVPAAYKGDKLTDTAFFKTLDTSKPAFCSFAEKANKAYILSNGEKRNYTDSPNGTLKIKFTSYDDCVDSFKWTNTDLYTLYANIYDDYLGKITVANNPSIIEKANNAKRYNLKKKFNIVDDFPSFLKSSKELIPQDAFISLVKFSELNLIEFCEYSTLFIKAYRTTLPDEPAVTQNISDCYSTAKIDYNLAYASYKVYFEHVIQPVESTTIKKILKAKIPHYND